MYNFPSLLLLSLGMLAGSAPPEGPSDQAASSSTKNLFRNLSRLSRTGFMFGHQDDLAYGVNWKYEQGRSDVKEVCGDYPAVYGWDISGIETGDSVNIDGVPFEKMKEFIREGRRRGGVVTISWHMKNPLGGTSGSWDTTRLAVNAILPNGQQHALFKSWLDSAASFLGSLKDDQGVSIPVLFRPLHELTGNWFWWGSNRCTPEEFKSLWKFTVQYLQSKKNLHNILWVYNTGGNFSTAGQFLERYPGDEFVDVLSFDHYQDNSDSTGTDFRKTTSALLDIVQAEARRRNKLFALSEAGYEAVPYAQWWTGVLAKAIGDHQVSYVLLWRNHGYHESMKRMHFYVPYAGQISANDFRKFYSLDKTLFGQDVAKARLYENKN